MSEERKKIGIITSSSGLCQMTAVDEEILSCPGNFNPIGIRFEAPDFNLLFRCFLWSRKRTLKSSKSPLKLFKWFY